MAAWSFSRSATQRRRSTAAIRRRSSGPSGSVSRTERIQAQGQPLQVVRSLGSYASPVVRTAPLGGPPASLDKRLTSAAATGDLRPMSMTQPGAGAGAGSAIKAALDAARDELRGDIARGAG